MLFRPKIVRFKDGTYAVRFFTLFGYEYLDLTTNTILTHNLKDDNFKDCKGDFATVSQKISFFYPKKEKHDCGKPVDFDYGSKT
jgi:hypothetical protein